MDWLRATKSIKGIDPDSHLAALLREPVVIEAPTPEPVDLWPAECAATPENAPEAVLEMDFPWAAAPEQDAYVPADVHHGRVYRRIPEPVDLELDPF